MKAMMEVTTKHKYKQKHKVSKSKKPFFIQTGAARKGVPSASKPLIPFRLCPLRVRR
jgi:hypothetical protein